MIRIKGFARKTRRLTKGGSLPENARDARSDGASSDGHSTSRSETTLNQSHSNGATPANLSNGAHRNGASGSNGQRASAADMVTEYLHGIVSALIPSPRTLRRPSGPGSNEAHLSSSNGASLQTLLARATEDKRAAESKALPAWKRALDISCIVLAFPIWLPLLVMVMIWIKAVSPGPIFYRQERVGYRRSRFMIFKFRTMHANAETRSHEEYFAHLMRVNCPMTKLDAVDDSRLVRCGRLLRASGLDELPQIFNVLRGEMSLVGPRPCLPKEFERYQPCHRRRVNAPPGLTGYWQVNGKNKTTFSQMIAMDILYAKKMSLWLDLTIMLKTIPALISQTAESRLASRTDRTVATGATVHGTNGSTTKI
ncbi:MAG: hypothetical protein QOH39_2185 [Verrucomicrobiota bacterium]